MDDQYLGQQDVHHRVVRAEHLRQLHPRDAGAAGRERIEGGVERGCHPGGEAGVQGKLLHYSETPSRQRAGGRRGCAPPAIAPIMAATHPTPRPIAPAWSRVQQEGNAPLRSTAP